jgi:hypothetical protein
MEFSRAMTSFRNFRRAKKPATKSPLDLAKLQQQGIKASVHNPQ